MPCFKQPVTSERNICHCIFCILLFFKFSKEQWKNAPQGNSEARQGGGNAPHHQALGNTAQKGMGRAEKGQVENKDALTTEHPSELFKSKTTVVLKAGAFHSPGGGEAALHFTPLCVWKGTARAEAVCWGSPPRSTTAPSNTCSGSTGARQVFSAVVTTEIISGREFDFSFLSYRGILVSG